MADMRELMEERRFWAGLVKTSEDETAPAEERQYLTIRRTVLEGVDREISERLASCRCDVCTADHMAEG